MHAAELWRKKKPVVKPVFLCPQFFATDCRRLETLAVCSGRGRYTLDVPHAHQLVDQGFLLIDDRIQQIAQFVERDLLWERIADEIRL
jgi:hypothetical protein